jgi:hypothetical protein
MDRREIFRRKELLPWSRRLKRKAGDHVPARGRFLVLATAGLVTAGVTVGVTALGIAQRGAPDPARHSSRLAPDPEVAVVHRSTQDPQEVRRHWTPDRMRQAHENMRHRTGPDD